MIKVEHRPNEQSVALAFDSAGGLALIDLIRNMIETGENDHIHLTDFQPPNGPRASDRMDRSLSLEPLSNHPNAQVASLLTVIFKADLNE